MKADVLAAGFKTLAGGVRALGWKVVIAPDRIAYYTTTAGRVGTLTLRSYDSRTSTARFTVDLYSARRRGRNALVAPELPLGARGSNELSCAASEVATLAAWLPTWLAAYDAGRSLPASPVPLAHSSRSSDAWEGGYRWTVGGNDAFIAGTASRAT